MEEHLPEVKVSQGVASSDFPAGAAFASWLRYNASMMENLDLVKIGCGYVVLIPTILSKLDSMDPTKDVPSVDRDLAVKTNAEIARRELDAEFPLLHAQSLVGLWGAFECLVEDVFTSRLAQDPTLVSAEPFAKIKLPASILLMRDGFDVHQVILSEFSRNVGFDLSQGATRFERLLIPVGLGGEVPDELRDMIFEAQQIRHVWAHRAGIADAKFVERCPGLGTSVGARIDLGNAEFSRYMAALQAYGLIILNRYRHLCGLSPEGVPDHPLRDLIESASPG